MINGIYPTASGFNLSMLVFRIAIAAEMIRVHGLKKIGIGPADVEKVPNPLHLPELLNQGIAVSANLLFPMLIIFGFLTRFSLVPILAVTITGFIFHWNDAYPLQDVPYMYSIAFLLVFSLGPGEYSVDYLIDSRKLKY